METVEFTEADETIDLPPPMSIMELENMTLAQKKMASVNIIEAQEDKAAEIDMEVTLIILLTFIFKSHINIFKIN